MRLSLNVVAAVAAAASLAAAVSTPAFAACKRYGFTVNDYGKDGPTKDAKSLLDKMIASKMAEQGIKDYSTGKKSVSCDLFLDFIVFDEHTCTAEATVCWGGSQLPGSERASSDDEGTSKAASSEAGDAKPAKTKKKDLAKKSDGAIEKTKSAANVVADPKPHRPKIAKPAAAEAQPVEAEPEAPAAAAVEQESSPADTAVAAPEEPAASESAAAKAPAASQVETGSLNEGHAEHKAHKKPAPSNDDDAAGYPSPVPPQEPTE